jgi:hypothetical protein
MLTKELLHEYFDYQDGKLLWSKMSGTRSDLVGKEAGSINEQNYRRIKIGNKLYMAHRVVFMYHHGYMPTEVDHIDCDRQNNRIENLRAVSKKENCWNRKMPTNNTSGIKGVCWHKSTNRWYVQLQVNKKMKYLGTYEDIELAELVAIEARSKYHGEFARNN